MTSWLAAGLRWQPNGNISALSCAEPGARDVVMPACVCEGLKNTLPGRETTCASSAIVAGMSSDVASWVGAIVTAVVVYLVLSFAIGFATTSSFWTEIVPVFVAAVGAFCAGKYIDGKRA
jgi:hypothetical protein